MAPRVQNDPVPIPVAGVVTMQCECGWEMPFIQPEEHIEMLQRVLWHLKEKHGIEFPTIQSYWH